MPGEQHLQQQQSVARRGSNSRGSSSRLACRPPVPRLDGQGIAVNQRQRHAKQELEEAIKVSKAEIGRRAAVPTGAKTHRAVLSEKTRQLRACTDWAVTIEEAIAEGIDAGVSDSLLEAGALRIIELEEQAAEDAAEAKAAHEARLAIASMPIKTPVTRVGSKAQHRAKSASRVPLGEGSIVQLKDLEEMSGISRGCLDVRIDKYNGRKGRVSKEPPPWVIKAVGKDLETKGATNERLASLGGLVPVLLEPRNSDADRHIGIWVAVPPSNLKVL